MPIFSGSPTHGNYLQSRATVSTAATWGRIRPVAFVVIWSAQTMRLPPALPQLASAVHLLVGRAAENLPEGRRLVVQDIIPIFRQAESAIRENSDNAGRLAALISVGVRG